MTPTVHPCTRKEKEVVGGSQCRSTTNTKHMRPDCNSVIIFFSCFVFHFFFCIVPHLPPLSHRSPSRHCPPSVATGDGRDLFSLKAKQAAKAPFKVQITSTQDFIRPPDAGPKFRSFSSVSRSHYRSFRLSIIVPQFSFFLPLGGRLVEFWWFLRRPGPSTHVWALGLWCEALPNSVNKNWPNSAK